MQTKVKAVLILLPLLLASLAAVHSATSASEAQNSVLAYEATAAALIPTPTATASSTPTSTATATNSPTPTATATPTATTSPTPTLAVTLLPQGRDGKAVIIDQAEQMMYVFQDGLLIRLIPVSTGRPTPNTFTPAWEGRIGHYVGTFSSFGTMQDEGWYLFQADGGILIHGAPYVIEDNRKVYQELDALGRHPASHGCIRLPPEEAVWFTKWGPEGAHCLITPLPPDKLR